MWCIATGGVAGCLVVDEERPKPDKPLEVQIKSQECWERHTYKLIRTSLHIKTHCIQPFTWFHLWNRRGRWGTWISWISWISWAAGSFFAGRSITDLEFSEFEGITAQLCSVDPWTTWSFCYVNREDSFGEQSAWPSFHSMFCGIETELDSHGSRGSRWSAGFARWLGDRLGQDLIWSMLKPSDPPELLSKVLKSCFFLDLYIIFPFQEVAMRFFSPNDSMTPNDSEIVSDLLLVSTHVVGWCSDSAAGWDDQQETLSFWTVEAKLLMIRDLNLLLIVLFVMILIVALYAVEGLGNCEIWTKVSPDAPETHRAQQDVVPGSHQRVDNTRRMIWKTGAVCASKLSKLSIATAFSGRWRSWCFRVARFLLRLKHVNASYALTTFLESLLRFVPCVMLSLCIHSERFLHVSQSRRGESMAGTGKSGSLEEVYFASCCNILQVWKCSRRYGFKQCRCAWRRGL